MYRQHRNTFHPEDDFYARRDEEWRAYQSGKNNDGPQTDNKTPEEELAELRAGAYADDPQKRYETARKVLIAAYANQLKLEREDELFLISIVTENSATEEKEEQPQAKEAAQKDDIRSEIEAGLYQKLEDLKQDENCMEPNQEYAIAKELLVAYYGHVIGISKEDEAFLVEIVRAQPTEILQDKTPCPCEGLRMKFTGEEVRTAAWNIIQSDPVVKDALFFYGGIKNNFADPTAWEKELNSFFYGDKAPRIGIKKLKYSGLTPDKDGPRKHKPISISKRYDFGNAVSTYLHELCHYMDIWYSSSAASRGKTPTKRDEYEMTSGVVPYKTASASDAQKTGYVDLSQREQQLALGEYMTVVLNQMLTDMKAETPQKDEHWKIPQYRLRYKKEMSRIRSSGASLTQQAQEEAAFVETIKQEIIQSMYGAYGPVTDVTTGTTDERWGLRFSNTSQSFSATGVELGYAFQKQAYGFYNPGQATGEWVVDFEKKFAEKYCQYLRY